MVGCGAALRTGETNALKTVQGVQVFAVGSGRRGKPFDIHYKTVTRRRRGRIVSRTHFVQIGRDYRVDPHGREWVRAHEIGEKAKPEAVAATEPQKGSVVDVLHRAHRGTLKMYDDLQ